MKRIIAIFVLIASCVITQGQTTHIIGCIGCVDSNRGNTSILGNLRVMTVPYKAPTTDSVLCRDIYGNIYRTKVSSGSSYTATYPIIITGQNISSDTGRSAAQLVTGGSLNKVRDSVAAYAATKQNTISVNAPILLSSNTISADTGRASAKLVTGGTLNSVRDSITSHFPASVTAGYGLTGTTTFNADTTVLQKKLTSGGRITYVGSLGYFDSVNTLNLSKLKVTGGDTLAATVINSKTLTILTNTGSNYGINTNDFGYPALYGFNGNAVSTLDIEGSNILFNPNTVGGGVINYTWQTIGGSSRVGSSMLGIGVAPTASANYGLVSLGTGPYDGSSTGKFAGKAAGTYSSINQPQSATADFANWQVYGSERFKVTSDGFLYLGGATYNTTSGNGGIFINNPNGGDIFTMSAVAYTNQYIGMGGDGGYGYLKLVNNGTGARLQGVGASMFAIGDAAMTYTGRAGYPALRRNGTTLEVKLGDNSAFTNLTVGTLTIGTSIHYNGSGSPEGVVTAVVGSIYTRSDGGAGTTLYVKESGSGNTGWIAK